MKIIKQLWGDPVASKVIAAIILAAFGYMFSIFQEMDIYKWIALAVVIVLTFLIYLFGPSKIQWNFDWFLGMTGVTNGGETRIQVLSFQASAINNKSTAISSIYGQIKSNISNEIIPIYLVVNGQPVECSKVQAIPPRAKFQIMAPLKPLKGMSLESGRNPDVFLSEFGDFTLEVSIDEKIFRKRFKKKNIEKLIDQFKKVSSPKKDTIFLKQDV